MGDLPAWALEKARAIGDRRLSKLRKLDRDTVEWVENDIAQALVDERELCCKAVCTQCRIGNPVRNERSGNWSEWVHIDKDGGNRWHCLASRIRERTDG